MGTVTLEFEIDPGDSESQWIAVDDKDVPLVNQKGTVDVDGTLPKHALTWWFTGDSGATIKIAGKLDGAKVVSVSSSIPDGEHDGGGRRRFKLSSEE